MSLLVLVVILVVIGLAGGISQEDDNKSGMSSRINDVEKDGEEEWVERMSADECDRYWDPPGDNI